MSDFIQGINWSPLWISLKTGAVATAIAFFLGIWCARKIMKMKPVSRAVLDGILTLPPTVAGFFLLVIFSLRRPFGRFLLESFDIKIVQTWKGCIVAAAVIAFPLMYRNARAAFEQVDVNLIYAGQTLGMSERRIYCGAGNRFRYGSGICPGHWRIRRYLYAGRKHPWKDQDGFCCYCNGNGSGKF